MALFQQYKSIILEKFMQLNVTASDNKNVSTFLLEPFVYTKFSSVDVEINYTVIYWLGNVFFHTV